MEKTLVIIKPDAVKSKHIGDIISRFEKEDFNILGIKMLKLTKDEAENFYYVHRGKDFFEGLVNFMTSDRCVPMVLEGENAIKKVREIIGATDSRKAAPGTIRAQFGTDNSKNAVHASDSEESARFEINFFFPELV